MRKFVVILTLLILVSCTPNETVKIQSLTLYSPKAKKLTKWYEKNLELERIDDNTLQLGDFTINIKSPEGLGEKAAGYHTGYSKFGFSTNDFEGIHDQLKSKNADFVGGIFQDENLGIRSFLVKDEDGNLIQIFEAGRQRLRPYFFAEYTTAIGESEKWYQMNMPVENTFNLDVADKNIYIRLMQGKGFLIELIQHPDAQNGAGFTPGYKAITLQGGNYPFESDKDGNKLLNASFPIQ